MIVIVLTWVFCGIAAAMIGNKKGCGGQGFFLGFFFGPFGLLFILLAEGNRRQCPACKSMIYPEATICPHCRTGSSCRYASTAACSSVCAVVTYHIGGGGCDSATVHAELKINLGPQVAPEKAALTMTESLL